mmetsp:Transcript_43934/g.117306  ORF Transcript_43934/g.117306 Transcript_43934/m.117306 type:complete len:157 (+) Transcript_43934:34-504(+)
MNTSQRSQENVNQRLQERAASKTLSLESDAQEYVPPSLKKLRELSESLRASLPPETSNPVDERAQSNQGLGQKSFRKAKSSVSTGVRADRTGAKRRGGAEALLAANQGGIDDAELPKTIAVWSEKIQVLEEERGAVLAQGQANQRAFIQREKQVKL